MVRRYSAKTLACYRARLAHDQHGFEIGCTVNRKDWGITWNAPLEVGGVLVGDKVTLDIDVSAVKRSG